MKLSARNISKDPLVDVNIFNSISTIINVCHQS